MDAILRLRNVRHQYNGRTVLDIPELTISGGSITGLAGPNGSGKSTMLKILSQVERCSSGLVFFKEKTLMSLDMDARRLLAYLPQETYLLKRSVFDNIAYGLKVRGRNSDLHSSVRAALELVGLSPSFADRQWHELSGGESQRVALAARLALKPACLMLDEPTASVDMESARIIHRAILSARQEWGTTLVISSHHQSWLNGICDRLIYLFKGRLLDCSYKNVLLGPWEKFSSELSVMRMTDGQLFYVGKPPGPESSGVMAPHNIRITSSQPTQGYKISGRVTGIFADNDPRILSVHAVCGEQQFSITMPENELLKEGVLPNQNVTLLYSPQDIVWLS